MPHLAAEGSAAAAADQPIGKQAPGAGVAASALSTLHFQLHQIEYLPADNPRMAVLHKELRRLALVDFGGFGKKIHREGLLQQRVALVFLVGQNGFHRAARPPLLSARRGYPLLCQQLRDAGWRLPVQKQAVDLPHGLRFLFIHHRRSVLAPVVAQEAPVGHGHLAVRDAPAPAPGHVLRNAAAFFLGKAGHDGDHQLSLAVQSIDVLLFKRDPDPFFLQLPDGGQAVHRVPGEAADAFCNNPVDLPSQRIRDQPVKALPTGGGGGRNTVIRIQARVFPLRVVPDQAAVIVALGLEGSLLLLLIGTDPGVSGYPGLPYRLQGDCGTGLHPGRDGGDLPPVRHDPDGFRRGGCHELRHPWLPPFFRFRLWSRACSRISSVQLSARERSFQTLSSSRPS